MSSRFNRQPQTHKPLPWCKKEQTPWIPIPGQMPGALRARVFFSQSSGVASPKGVAFYFANIPRTITGAYSALAKTGTNTCQINISLSGTPPQIQISAFLTPPSTDDADMGSISFQPDEINPIHTIVHRWSTGYPPDQKADIEVWQ